MTDGYLFIALLALTIGTLGIVGVQLVFGLLEVKKRRLQERLGTTNPKDQILESAYGSIANAEQVVDPGMMSRSAFMRAWASRLSRAYPGVVMRRFVNFVIIITVVTAIGGYLLTGSILVAFIAAAGAACVPFLVVRSKCNSRQKVVEDQLPEALEFLARVLPRGHSLATGLQMAADELPDPLASEFRKCYDQHSLGQTLEEALKETAERVGSADFAFFVTAVLIQRQTGGDLAEVLSNISNMIRSRIRLQQHVQAITAEGRLVGYILLVLPIIFFLILYGVNPDYAGVLLNTSEGTWVLGFALVLQVLGLVSIKKIVAVKM